MADPDLSATFRKPFAEQVAAWRLRLQELRPTYAWDQYEPEAHARAFMVAGATKADLLADLAEAVDRAIAEGTGIEAFRRDFREITDRLGWPGKAGQGSEKGFAWRTRVIYRTNMRTSYMTGRRAQLVEGGFKFWVYRHSGAVEPRLQHLAWDGVALPPDHPFWDTHYPPNGWGCGCRVRGADTEAGIRRMGGDPDKALPEGWDARDLRTGAPKGIDRGWDHSVGATVAEDIVRAMQRKLPALPPQIGAAFALDAVGQVDKAWKAWVRQALDGNDRTPGFLGALSPDVVAAIEGEVAQPAADLWMIQGLISGPKGRRHTEAGDALSEEQWLGLPSLLRTPVAVLLDVRSGKLLLVLGEAGDRRPQIAVEVDVDLKVARGDIRRTNVVRSAFRPRLDDLLARLRGGQLKLLTGALE